MATTTDIRIEPGDAKRAVDAGEAIILDVVAPHVWSQMHRAISGALRMSLDDLNQRYGELPRDREIVVYCTWPHEGSSARAAQFLREHGYRARALRGGYVAWRDLGYPLEPKEVEQSTTVADACPDCGSPSAEHGS